MKMFTAGNAMHRLSQYISYIDQKRAALFFGAGISAIAGCSNLKDILRKLKEKVQSIEDDIKSQDIDNVPPRQIIAYYKSKFGSTDTEREYKGILREALTPDPDKFHKVYVPLIKKIKTINPFPPIITTNADPCLTHTKEFNMVNIFYNIDDMEISNFQNGGIFHLHGYTEDPEGQVWDIFDYDRRYNQEFKDFLLEIFNQYSILFLGYALDDQELLLQMANAKKRNTLCPTHFALLPEDDCPPAINETIFERLYNIKIIKYGPKENFVQIFGKWIDANFGPMETSKADEAMYS